ncbi:MAG: response regulator [Candidatus Binataceae bacterium]|nr:response regulator [Candidatus Binataceae bacterium]
MRLLIVDDNQDTIESAAQLFALWKHDVLVARSGPEALKIAAELPLDAVLLDIGLPEMTGYEVARRMRKDVRLKDVVLIAISGYGQPRDRQLSREAGFDEHHVKPVNLEQLNLRLAEMIKAKTRNRSSAVD